MAEVKRAVKFKNIDTEKFSYECDGVLYELEAGEVMMFPEAVARFLAKHLAMKCSGYVRSSKVDDRGIPIDSVVRDLYAKILTTTSIEAKNEAELAHKMVNENPFIEQLSKEVTKTGTFKLPEPENEIEKIVNNEIISLSEPMKLMFNGKIYANMQGFLASIGVYRKKRIEEITKEKSDLDEGSEGDGDLGEEDITE